MKCIFIFLCLILNISLHAQSDYQSFLLNHKFCVENYSGTGSGVIKYESANDTLINSLSYRIFKNATNNSTKCFLREDEFQRKVWMLVPEETNERLLYDFSLLAGESFIAQYSNGSSATYFVDSIGTVSTISGLRKKFYLSTLDSPLVSTLNWIEGIGAANGPFYLSDSSITNDFGGLGFCLIASYSDSLNYLGACGIPFTGGSCGDFFYSVINLYEKDFSIYPNPVTNKIFLQSVNYDKVEIKIYNTLGEEVFANKKISFNTPIDIASLPSGIYFINIISNNNSSCKKIIKN